jgi:hypothetical protein
VTSSVDLDRLADYAAGALEGADEAAVAHLLHTDAAWRSAYAALVAADDLVRTQLRAEAHRRLEPMPADVVVRIDAALAELAPSGAAPARHRVAEVVPLASHTRRRRLTVGFASAAAAVILVIGGVGVLGNSLAKSSRENSAAMAPAEGQRVPNGAGDAAAPPAPTALFGTGRAASTGTNYDAVGLAGLAAAAARSSYLALPSPIPFSGTSSPTKAMAPEAPTDKAAVPPSLHGLAQQTQLATCLSAIQRLYPGTVALLDYARYLGQPALIVVIATEGHTTAVAVGPQCGVSGAQILAVAQG